MSDPDYHNIWGNGGGRKKVERGVEAEKRKRQGERRREGRKGKREGRKMGRTGGRGGRKGDRKAGRQRDGRGMGGMQEGHVSQSLCISCLHASSLPAGTLTPMQQGQDRPQASPSEPRGLTRNRDQTHCPSLHREATQASTLSRPPIPCHLSLVIL